MSRITIVEGNSNDKDNVRVIMVKGEKGEQGDLNHNDIIDNLTSTATDKVLSAKQGKVLKDAIDDIEDVFTGDRIANSIIANHLESKNTVYIRNDDYFDNDEDPTTEEVPRVTADGMLNIFDGHLKFFADMDGDGDYDADMYSKDNMYLCCGNSTHIILNQGINEQKEGYGRIVFAGTANTNYIQSGKNYSGSELKHLAFSGYKNGDYYLIFNKNTGFTGIGKYYSDPKARLHVNSDENTLGIFENYSGTNSRIAFKTTTETEYNESTIGLEQGTLVLRNGSVEIIRMPNTGENVLPGVAGTTSLGSLLYPWASLYSKAFDIRGTDATIGAIENTSGTVARVAFRNTNVQGTNCTAGLDGNAFVVRTNGTNKLRIDSGDYVLPGLASTTNLGSTAYPWANIYSVNAVTVTSDKRRKKDIKAIDEKVFEAWSNIEYKQYKIKNSDDKIHFGVIAQDIIKEFEKVGLNALDYGLVVYDEENDIYNVRYAEINVLENAYMRHLMKK